MERVVRVKSLNPDGTAQVLCKRESACGGNCAQCGGCAEGQKTMEVTALNPIGATPGDRVILETSTGEILGLVVAVYLIPIVLLIASYCAFGLWAGLLGLAMGFLGVVFLDRSRAKRKKNTFTITGYAQD